MHSWFFSWILIECGLLQDRLLLINNYSKHICWIFINGLSHTEVCLHAAARSSDLISVNALTHFSEQWMLLLLMVSNESSYSFRSVMNALTPYGERWMLSKPNQKYQMLSKAWTGRLLPIAPAGLPALWLVSSQNL